MHAVKWLVGALATLALMGICVVVGTTLMPPMSVAQTKGTFVPWLLTWFIILATAAMGVAVAVYMAGIGLGKVDA
jgi:hypothetical protein